MHRTLLFLVPEEAVTLVPQPEYARLLRGEKRLEEHADTAVRVADWYYEIPDAGEPRLVNETYSVLRFDEAGRIDWARCRAGGPRNQALYEALRRSPYDDPDDDPAVRARRARLCDEVTWLPDRAERARLHAAARRALEMAA
jgi:hypothetical protein